MPRRKDLRMDRSLKQIMKERFVHSLSKEVYDKVATLWHIDRESEKLMSQIASKVVVGFFCLEYLSYIHTLIKEKAGIKDNISASDLSDEDLVADVRTRLSDNKEAALIFKSAVCRLKKIIGPVNITTLEDKSDAEILSFIPAFSFIRVWMYERYSRQKKPTTTFEAILDMSFSDSLSICQSVAT